MEPQIIYNDRQILIIDKPGGMPTVNAAGGMTETLAKWIITNFPKQQKLKAAPHEAGLINRLDNDTSGLVVAARTDKAYKSLKDAWRGRDVLKEYNCLVLGQTPPEGRITTLIAHHPDKSKRMIVVEDEAEAKRLKARFAETEYHIIETFLDYTYLKVGISTGVRHQIRCHLASIGYPVAGDRLYQRIKHMSRDWLGLTRHFLHATKIGFVHPSSGRYIEFESPIPEDLRAALKRLDRF